MNRSLRFLGLLDSRHGRIQIIERPYWAPHLPVRQPGQIGGNKAAAVGQKNSACDGCKRGAEMLLRLHDEYVCVQRFNSICSEKAEVLYLNVVGCKNNFYGAITHRRRR